MRAFLLRRYVTPTAHTSCRSTGVRRRTVASSTRGKLRFVNVAKRELKSSASNRLVRLSTSLLKSIIADSSDKIPGQTWPEAFLKRHSFILVRKFFPHPNPLIRWEREVLLTGVLRPIVCIVWKRKTKTCYFANSIILRSQGLRRSPSPIRWERAGVRVWSSSRIIQIHRLNPRIKLNRACPLLFERIRAGFFHPSEGSLQREPG